MCNYILKGGLIMCGRYWVRQCPELDDIIKEMSKTSLYKKWNEISPVKKYGEICPTDVTAVIASDSRGIRSVFPMKWGYDIGKVIINARVETASIKPLFREDWLRHRCIIPASWYFEWEHVKGNDGKVHITDKYMIHPKNSLTWLCGLYTIKDELPYFTILTRSPCKDIEFINDRMPLILPANHINDWINPYNSPDDMIQYAITDMAFEKSS